MRVFYLDPALASDLGHHANSCRCITNELRSRGIETKIFSSHKTDTVLQNELRACPHFRADSYWLNDGDPICRWLNAFEASARLTCEDLAKLVDICADDIVYLNSGQAAQLYGLALWSATMPANELPRIVMEFGMDPGVDVRFGPNGMTFSTRDPRMDPRAILLRFACQKIPPGIGRHIRVGTCEPNSTAVYRPLLGRDVEVFPLPRDATTAVRRRVGKRPITVSVLGHQRREKGYHLMPEIARQLLAKRRDINILVHNGDPELSKAIQQDLRQLAIVDPRLIVDERIAGRTLWPELLDKSDLVLCPYTSSRFAVSYSAVASEAVANGMPLVVPARSSLARLLSDFGDSGELFEKAEPSYIVAATLRALSRFDDLAQIAMRGAKKWNEVHGPRRFVDALLKRQD